MGRPRVGVSGPRRGGAAAWSLVRLALWRAGATAVRLYPPGAPSLADLDALVLTGGADIAPHGWQQPYGAGHVVADAIDDARHDARRGLAQLVTAPLLLAGRRLLAASAARVDTARDRFERALLDQALARQMPILGICRGAQLLNLHAGGTLHREIAGLYGEVPHPRTVLAHKRIAVAPRSQLARILDASECKVNALHHQAIREPGRGFVVVATDEAGVVQAIERESHELVIGVQWHPEYMPLHRRQMALFEALAAAAARRRGR